MLNMQLIFIKENYPENMGIFMLYVDVSCDQKNVRPRVVWSVIRYMYLNGANDQRTLDVKFTYLVKIIKHYTQIAKFYSYMHFKLVIAF
jgi:hypothetical protein